MYVSLSFLLSELKLSNAYESVKKLKVLQDWCHNYVSKDIAYFGSPAEQYEQYINLARTYLEVFLPNSTNLQARMIELNGLNPIQYAAQAGYHFFIEQQESLTDDVVSATNKHQMTPLHISAVSGHYYTTLALLKHNAKPQQKNARQLTAPFCALLLPINHSNALVLAKIKTFNELMTKRLQLWHHTDANDENLVHYMVKHEGFESLVNKALAEAPQLVLAKNQAGHYPIHTAILNRQNANAALLLGVAGVSTQEDRNQRKPLHYAANHGTKEMVELCYTSNPKLIEAEDENKMTPALVAAQAGNQSALDFLLDHEANAHATDSQGFNILHHAVKANNLTLTQWILTQDLAELADCADNEGHTPLFYAKKNNNTAIEELLADCHSSTIVRPR